MPTESLKNSTYDQNGFQYRATRFTEFERSRAIASDMRRRSFSLLARRVEAPAGYFFASVRAAGRRADDDEPLAVGHIKSVQKAIKIRQSTDASHFSNN